MIKILGYDKEYSDSLWADMADISACNFCMNFSCKQKIYTSKTCKNDNGCSAGWSTFSKMLMFCAYIYEWFLVFHCATPQFFETCGISRIPPKGLCGGIVKPEELLEVHRKLCRKGKIRLIGRNPAPVEVGSLSHY